MEVDEAEVVHGHADEVVIVVGVIGEVLGGGGGVGEGRDEGAGARGRLARPLLVVLLVLQQGVQVGRADKKAFSVLQGNHSER